MLLPISTDSLGCFGVIVLFSMGLLEQTLQLKKMIQIIKAYKNRLSQVQNDFK